MIRSAFIRRCALAVLASAFFEVRLPEVATEPDPRPFVIVPRHPSHPTDKWYLPVESWPGERGTNYNLVAPGTEGAVPILDRFPGYHTMLRSDLEAAGHHELVAQADAAWWDYVRENNL